MMSLAFFHHYPNQNHYEYNTANSYFVVDTPFDFWSNTLIRYEGGSDVAGITCALLPFKLQYVANPLPEPTTATSLYVDSSVGASSDGSSPAQAFKTYGEAADVAVGGTTIWIKAGNYGNEIVNLKTSTTTAETPIKIIGYKSTPGDNPSYTRTVGMSFASTEMPLFVGSNMDGDALYFDTNYIVLRNVAVGNFKRCVYTVKSFMVVDNVFTRDCSNGIRMGIKSSQNMRVINSFAGDHYSNGIQTTNKNNLMMNVWAVSSRVVDMDYYLTVYGGNEGTNNCVRKSYIYRFPMDSHGGHGVSHKAGTQSTKTNKLRYSLAENVEVINTSMEARHSSCQYSVFRNINVDNRALNDQVGEGEGIKIYEGPSFAHFEDITIRGGGLAFWWFYFGEDTDNQLWGHDILFLNCRVDGTRQLFSVSDKGHPTEDFVHDNVFENLYVTNAYRWFATQNKPLSASVVCKRCIFSTIEKRGPFSDPLPLMTFEDSVQWANLETCDWPGSGNIDANPMFADSPNLDFTIGNPVAAAKVAPPAVCGGQGGAPTSGSSNAPTAASTPTKTPTPQPTRAPTPPPTAPPTASPTVAPGQPSAAPTTKTPSKSPTPLPTQTPTSRQPTVPKQTLSPTPPPTLRPTFQGQQPPPNGKLGCELYGIQNDIFAWFTVHLDSPFATFDCHPVFRASGLRDGAASERLLSGADEAGSTILDVECVDPACPTQLASFAASVAEGRAADLQVISVTDSEGRLVTAPSSSGLVVGLVVGLLVLLAVAALIVLVLVRSRRREAGGASAPLSSYTSGGGAIYTQPLVASAATRAYSPAHALPVPPGMRQFTLLEPVAGNSAQSILGAQRGDVARVKEADLRVDGDWVWASVGGASGYLPRNFLREVV